MMNPTLRPFTLCVCLLLVSGLTAQDSRARRSLVAPLPTTAAEKALRTTPVVRAVRKAAPAVISVYVRNAGRRAMIPGLGQRPRGQGSGVIIDEVGLALTNWHVVYPAIFGDGLQRSDRRVEARLSDGRVFRVRVLSSSPERDLALLRLELPKGQRLKALELGDSGTLMMGETVIAIGNPLGQADTVSVGVLSARNRNIGVRTPDGRVRNYKGLLQTDAAINPGNSGGALIDLTGKLVGINNAMASEGVGIGFSIPVNTVRKVFKNDLLSVDRLRSTYLGLNVIATDGRLEVSRVVVSSPADIAGLRLGDRLVSVAGQKVKTQIDLARVRLDLQAGSRVPVIVQRQGRPQRLSLRPTSYEAWNISQLTGLWLNQLGARNNEGLVQTANRALSRELRGRVAMGGLLRVQSVQPGTGAARLGLRKNDVVLGLEVPELSMWGDVVGTQFVPFDSLENAQYYLRSLSRRRESRYDVWVLRDDKLFTGPLRLANRQR